MTCIILMFVNAMFAIEHFYCMDGWIYTFLLVSLVQTSGQIVQTHFSSRHFCGNRYMYTLVNTALGLAHVQYSKKIAREILLCACAQVYILPCFLWCLCRLVGGLCLSHTIRTIGEAALHKVGCKSRERKFAQLQVSKADFCQQSRSQI